jgi:hypothetical protein
MFELWVTLLLDEMRESQAEVLGFRKAVSFKNSMLIYFTGNIDWDFNIRMYSAKYLLFEVTEIRAEWPLFCFQE